jgi:hypothetical protein
MKTPINAFGWGWSKCHYRFVSPQPATIFLSMEGRILVRAERGFVVHSAARRKLRPYKNGLPHGFRLRSPRQEKCGLLAGGWGAFSGCRQSSGPFPLAVGGALAALPPDRLAKKPETQAEDRLRRTRVRQTIPALASPSFGCRVKHIQSNRP